MLKITVPAAEFGMKFMKNLSTRKSRLCSWSIP